MGGVRLSAILQLCPPLPPLHPSLKCQLMPSSHPTPCLPRGSLGGQVLQGGEGRVAGRGWRHAVHLAWRVGGGAHAAKAAVQQVRRVAGGRAEGESESEWVRVRPRGGRLMSRITGAARLVVEGSCWSQTTSFVPELASVEKSLSDITKCLTGGWAPFWLGCSYIGRFFF